MQIRCSKCGEELMGSVNRCWRCGHRFVHTADKNTLPPIRRAPVVLDAPNREVVAVPIEAPRPEAEPAASSRAVRRYVESLVLQQRMLLPYAYASTVIGGIGCLTGWFTWWTIIPALVGVALGILGRNSTRNDIATTGIILCSIAIFASAVNAAYALFSIYYSRMLIDGFYDQQF